MAEGQAQYSRNIREKKKDMQTHIHTKGKKDTGNREDEGLRMCGEGAGGVNRFMQTNKGITRKTFCVQFSEMNQFNVK